MTWVSWWLSVCGLALLGTLVAAALHEATHAAAAHVVGGRVERVGLTSIGAPFVEWREPADADDATIRFVQLAPAIVGWGSLLAILGTRGWPSLSVASALGFWIWAVYTLGGGIEDYSLAHSRQEQTI